ncbi:MAG: hypothetical protein CM1200mP29_06470 [Verrucomicrobiota bacterium]|nr:MAG: hypothetical protein CM1200mP29_06470 [Verrucomicrobiota bacterium]
MLKSSTTQDNGLDSPGAMLQPSARRVFRPLSIAPIQCNGPLLINQQ